MKEVYEFLKKCETYYLATLEGDKPHVRPFGTVNIFEDKLYIQTGKVKPCAKQILENPNAEICAFDGKTWVRIACKLIEDDRVEARKSMLDSYPHLRSMYSETDGNTVVFFMKDAVATFEEFGQEKRIIEF